MNDLLTPLLLITVLSLIVALIKILNDLKKVNQTWQQEAQTSQSVTQFSLFLQRLKLYIYVPIALLVFVGTYFFQQKDAKKAFLLAKSKQLALSKFDTVTIWEAPDPLSINAEKTALNDIFETILKNAIAVDASLEKAVLAEKTKQLQSLDALESRILKAEKQKHETALNQLKAVQQKLFPNSGLQERTDNILPIYLKHGDAFFDVLKAHLNPLEQGMVVISE